MLSKFHSITNYFLSVALAICLILIPFLKVSAEKDTGGYPWANAALVNRKTFDWGYVRCQSPMQKADMCKQGKVSYKKGIRYFQSDPWHYDVRNCTSFVAWKLNKMLGVRIPGWGNANNWTVAAKRSGYVVNNQPAIGSIAYWPGKYGHVAYVTKVNKDKSVTVEQYNRAGQGEFSRQYGVRAVKYIHIKPVARVKTSQASTNSAKVKQTPMTATKVIPKIIKLDNLSQPTDGQQLLPNKDGFSYSMALDPTTNQVQAYAVQSKFTSSGKIEISQSNYDDGNTTWTKTWITDISVQDQSTNYIVADNNKDKILDLSIIGLDDPKQGSQVIILDGSKDFKIDLFNGRSQKLDQAKSSDKFEMADFDGNGTQDLFRYREKKNDSIDLTIFDGSNNFNSEIISKQITLIDDVVKINITLTDQDRDGRIDILQQNMTEIKQPLSSLKVTSILPGDD